MRQQWRRVAVDLILVGALILAGLRYTWGIGLAVDVGLYDESIYLFNGMALLTAEPRDYEARALNAPLYAAWYALLWPLAGDRVNLYLLNQGLMIGLPPLLLYIAARRLGAAPLAACAAALCFLLALANAAVWPKISHFALGLGLGVLALSGPAPPLVVALAGALGAAALSYVRPELGMAALLCAGLAAGWLWRERRAAGARGRLAGFGLSVGAALVLLALGPAAQGSRSYAAFSQHFALRWVKWTGSELNPWTNSAAIAAEAFGPATSIGGALRANPALFLRHVGANLLDIPQRLGALIWPAPLPMPPVPLAALITATLLASLLLARRRAGERNLRRLAGPLLVAACYAAPALIAALLIYPRDHYLVLPLGLGLAALAALTFGASAPAPPRIWAAALAAGLAVLLAPPRYTELPEVRPNIATITDLRALGIRSPVQMLEAAGGFYIYLGPNYRRVPEYEKQTGFAEYMAERRINMVVLTPSLLGTPSYRDDAAWQAFLADPGAAGFVRHEVIGTDRVLLVRSDLLPP